MIRVEVWNNGANDVLVRRGICPETAARLDKQAKKAQEAGFPHGVSVTTPESNARLACDPQDASFATKQAFQDAGFKVHLTPTRNDPFHHTVELPDPVTAEIATKFNEILGRIKR